MHQHNNTYTTEKLWKYQQQELERNIRKSEQVREAKAKRKAEKEQKAASAGGAAGRFKLPSYLSRWLLAKTEKTPDCSEQKRGEQLHAE
ncbi:hypothetical protein A8990_11111 [Paenibacillus taihuensis]|uniref:Uncharacterized protein n=1 Tax=Paenibacillus taihuensis TaxID=1156355 RepID=A0A3D9S6R7_9BACL|nr:hypothetical protein [Paenibacillus taihuensis]REE86115.1 hypothetical protein A8990_11111 [Paenibacillus taihuensis]